MNSRINISEVLLEKDLIPYDVSDFTGNKALIFAPHPDDETLGCAGSILKHISNGDEVKIIFVTAGDKGSGSNLLNKTSYVEIRKEEGESACKVLNVSNYTFWGWGDRKVDCSISYLKKIIIEINEYKPTLVYVTSPLELNPDHRNLARLVWAAINEISFDIKLAFYEISTPFQPNVLVDITSEMSTKVEALNCYPSQMVKIDYYDMMKSLNRFRALTVSGISKYAEGYMLFNSKQIKGYSLQSYFDLNPAISDNTNTEIDLVSIVVRTKNRSKLLVEALDSIASQTYPRIEVIVVNDGGRNEEISINEFRYSFRLKYIHLNQSRGRSAAANIGLNEATGQYIGFLDDDDIFLPGHISSLISLIKEKENCEFVYSDCTKEVFNIAKRIRDVLKPTKPQIFKGVNYNREKLYQGNFIPIMTALFTRNLLKKAGNIDENLDMLEDWDLWIRMSFHTDFTRLPIVTCKYRVYGSRSYDFAKNFDFIINKYPDIYKMSRMVNWLSQLRQENETAKNTLRKIINSF